MKIQIEKDAEKIVENKGIHQVSAPNRICPHPAEPNHTQPHPLKKALVEKDVENNVEITTSKKEFNFSSVSDILLKCIMAPFLCCFIFCLFIGLVFYYLFLYVIILGLTMKGIEKSFYNHYEYIITY